MKHRTKSHYYLRLIVIALCVLGVAALQYRGRVARAANTITVTNTHDSGPGSLRQAIDGAADGDTINITATGIITLTSGTLKISKKLTINGPGARVLAISGGLTFPVLEVGSDADAVISRVSISDGIIDPYNLPGSVFGSGISNYGTLRLSECLVTRHHSSQGLGVGIANSAGGVLTITNCEIANNLCSGIGNIGVATIANSAIINNTSFSGAGVLNLRKLDLTNTTISGNVATGGTGGWGEEGRGGAILTEGDSRISLTNCTITSNRANRGGGIVTPPPDGQSVIKVRNTIIAGNFAPTSPDLANDFTSEGHNLIGNNQGSLGFTHGVQGDLVGTPSAPLDPRLGPLINNGGPTPTHALLLGSPAIDAGDNQGAATTDQRGRPRLANGDGLVGSTIDIGAFEVQRLLVVTNTNDSGPDSLREAVLNSNLAGGGNITFNLPGAGPFNISLTGGRLPVTIGAAIFGPGADSLTISGNNTNRVFSVDQGASLYLSGLTLANGKDNDGQGGGAVRNLGALVIANSTIRNSTAGDASRGGAIFSSGGDLIVTGDTLSGNSAGRGGAVYFENGTASLTNCTLSGNSSARGSAIYNSRENGGALSSLTLTSCTITANTGSSAVWTEGVVFFNGAETYLENTLVANNTPRNFNTTFAALVSLGSNLDSDGTSGFTNGANGDLVGTGSHKIDARLGPLQDNGGPTLTHALLAGSPAIDHGSNTVTGPPHNLTTDQRGLPRSIDGDGDHASTVDIGAFEFVCSSPSIITQPSSQVVCLGTTAIFSVVATGTELSFQWRKNSVDINGATSASLTINAVAEGNAGAYDVVITGGCGQFISDAATLTVAALPLPPVITPVSTSVCTGSTGNSASGPAGASSYAWSISNGTINSATNTQTIVYTAGASGHVTVTLTITNASGCGAGNSITVPINPLPTTANAGPDQIVAGATATLAGNTPLAGTGVWERVSGVGTITHPTSPTSGVTGLGVGVNVFRWTISSGVCAASSDETVITRDVTPPAITCPANLYRATANASDAGVAVSFPLPVATDSSGVASVTCTPPSGSVFPVGATTVTCTAQDVVGNQASCSFTITVYNLSVQDQATGSYLLFNSATGAYYYRQCGASGLTLSGTGQVSTVGCTVRLTANSTNRITVTLNKCLGTATATVTTLSPVATYTLSDSNINNNSNFCSGG